MVHFIILLFLALVSNHLVLFCSSANLTRCNFPAIFNFGDSNSDTGALSAAFGETPYPNGETYFHAPAGRFCDGRLLIDFTAERLGLPFLSAYLDSIGANFSHGANFATAGSTIRPPNYTFAQMGYSPISLDIMFIQLSDFHRRSQTVRKQGGVFAPLLPQESHFANGLYTFDIGLNDVTTGYKLNMSTQQVKDYIPDVLGQLSKVIKGIYGEGGRSFWIQNAGPIGCMPYVMETLKITAAQIDRNGCAAPYNDIIRYFNLRLKERIAELRKDLPSAAITYVDTYTPKYYIISNAKKLGFKDPLIACCGHGGKFNYNRIIKCGTKKVVNGKEIPLTKTCKNPSIRVNWDGFHFTDAANKWIFDQIASGSFSDPPVPLTSACQRKI